MSDQHIPQPAPTEATAIAPTDGPALVGNITARGVRLRLALGFVALAMAAGGVGLLLAARTEVVTRLLFFPTFWLVGLCLFQAWNKT